jgi:DnaJ-class molecular chaperone
VSSSGSEPPIDIEQIFGDFFGSSLRGRGEDLVVPLELPADLARAGTRRTITVERRELCAICAGAGGESRPCPRCDGKGGVTGTQGSFRIVKRCAHCLGHGRIETRRCGACTDGSVLRSETLTVELPPNAQSGMQLRLAGKGHQGVGVPPGHLYVALTVIGEAPAPVDEGAIAAGGAHPFRERAPSEAPAKPTVRAVARTGTGWVVGTVAIAVAFAFGLIAYLHSLRR